MKNKKILSILIASSMAFVGCSQSTQSKVNEAKAQAATVKESQDIEKTDTSTTKTTSTKTKNEGDIAPDFTLKDRDGKEFTLSKQNGKKVYVKFWASWCHVCLEGMEELNKLAKEKNDFEVITIVSPGYGSEKSKEDFLKWFDEQPYNNIKVLFDEGGKVNDMYGVRAYPTSAAIGSDGVLVGLQAGHIPNNLLKEAFSQIQ